MRKGALELGLQTWANAWAQGGPESLFGIVSTQTDGVF